MLNVSSSISIQHHHKLPAKRPIIEHQSQPLQHPVSQPLRPIMLLPLHLLAVAGAFPSTPASITLGSARPLPGRAGSSASGQQAPQTGTGAEEKREGRRRELRLGLVLAVNSPWPCVSEVGKRAEEGSGYSVAIP